MRYFFNYTFILCVLCVAVSSVEGTFLNITKVNRLHMGSYLCIASNGVPPSVSKRIMLTVHCTYYPLAFHCTLWSNRIDITRRIWILISWKTTVYKKFLSKILIASLNSNLVQHTDREREIFYAKFWQNNSIGIEQRGAQSLWSEKRISLDVSEEIVEVVCVCSSFADDMGSESVGGSSRRRQANSRMFLGSLPEIYQLLDER